MKRYSIVILLVALVSYLIAQKVEVIDPVTGVKSIVTPDTRQRDLTAMRLVRTLIPVPNTSTGLSGVTYNQRSNTLFAIRNVTAGGGTIYEMTLEGVVLRTINPTVFEDTEAIEWICWDPVNSVDVFLIAEEDHTTTATDASLTLVRLAPGSTTLAKNTAGHFTATTAYSGGSGAGIGNAGLESVCYDRVRGVIYYTAEFGTQVAANDNTVWASGPRQAKIFTRPITPLGTMNIGTESVLCDISALFNGGALNGMDISDMAYDPYSDTILVASEFTLTDKITRLTRAGTVVESLNLGTTQCEGVAMHPDGDQLYIIGEPQEYLRYELGIHRGVATSAAAYGSGAAFTLTNSTTTITFGGTSPTITLPSPGTYALAGQIHVHYNAATFGANQTLTLRMRRTNNTAADVPNTTLAVTVDVTSVRTGMMGIITLPSVEYSTVNSNDIITFNSLLDVLPSAGSLQAIANGTSIRAVKLY